MSDYSMMKALEKDGEMLRQQTGEDHGPFHMGDPCDICGTWPCSHTDPDSWEFWGGIPVLKRAE